jgi:hypothetical protein
MTLAVPVAIQATLSIDHNAEAAERTEALAGGRTTPPRGGVGTSTAHMGT